MELQESDRDFPVCVQSLSESSTGLDQRDEAISDIASQERLAPGGTGNRNAAMRTVAIKRKLEDLEPAMCSSLVRPRWDDREDDVMDTASTYSDHVCNDSCSYASNGLESAAEKDEIIISDIDVSRLQQDDNCIFCESRTNVAGKGASAVKGMDTSDDVTLNLSSGDGMGGRIESSTKDLSDHVLSISTVDIGGYREVESMDCRSHDVLVASADSASAKEDELVKKKLEAVSDMVYHEARKKFTASTSSSVTEDNFYGESSFHQGSISSHMGLQFFVRTYMGGRTIVLHGNASDTIESVHRQIFLKTGLPICEQRLIYFGKQLQDDQTLGQCRIVNDATLHLVARMRSIALPHSWQLVDELIRMIRRTCVMEQESRYKLHQLQINIKSAVKDYLKLPVKFAPFSEHMQVFQLAGATTSLVMMLLSPVESNSECAEESIRLFFFPNEDCLPIQIHGHCAPVLLDFCKLLYNNAPLHPLYPACRSALACLLDSNANGSSYFHDVKAEIIIQDFSPFVNELSINLCSGLKSLALQLSVRARPARCIYAIDGQDFTAFATILSKAIVGTTRNTSVTMPQDILSHGIAVKISNKGALDANNLMVDDDVKDSSESDTGNIRLELGSYDWLKSLFYQLLQVLDDCLAAIQHSGRDQELAELLELMVGDEWHLICVLIVLKGLYAIAQFSEQCLKSFLRMLHIRDSALNLLIKQSRSQDDHSWLLDYKFLLNFESRKRLVMKMFPEPQDDHDERQELLVLRSKILSDSFEVIAYVDSEALQGDVSLEFVSEEATGPGVLREWFSLICREIFNPQNALFRSCPYDQRRVFPNPGSGVNPGHLTYFRFCGRIVALALMHRIQINVLFSLPFFKQLAGLPVSWQDIGDLDPVLYESCRKILLMEKEEIDSDVLGLTFMYEEEQLGITKAIELCPGGKDVLVNSENRVLYVDFLIQQRFVNCVVEQVKSFAQGFSELMATGNMEQFLRGLDAEDLDLILHGNNQDICLEDWKLHTEYHEYNDSDDQIIWFWQVLAEMTNEQRRNLLFFSTSVTHLPAEGFAGLPSRFHIHKSFADTAWLPTAHTCFYQLILPAYPTFETMQERLLSVTEVHIAEGFGFA